MRSGNVTLFVIPALIWGSTWFVIKFQLGTVDPLWSVGYRFLLAGIILLTFSWQTGKRLRFSIGDHLRIAMQGVLLFGLNYWMVYLAELELTSALMAVLFSGIMSLNILFSWLFLNRKSTPVVFLGALIGIMGTILIFYQELQGLKVENLPIKSTVLGILGVVLASLGNVTSAANQARSIPVISSNAFGMIYGGLVVCSLALVQGIPLKFDLHLPYVFSLIYLAIFGSIAAFGTYLTLIGRMGPDRAAYVLIVIPVIALIISTVYEGYNFSWYALGGVLLVMIGNLTIIQKPAVITETKDPSTA